jgi:hypothetical protein
MSHLVLQFPNIMIADCISEQYEETMMAEQTISKAMISCGYSDDYQAEFNEVIPEYFINLASWPKSTQLYCWYCQFKIESVPVPIPNGWIKLYKKTDGTITSSPHDNVEHNQMNLTNVNAIIVRGYCCCFACAKSYLININDDKISNVGQSLNHLADILKLFDYKASFVPVKPLPIIQKKYSGNSGLTPQQYIELRSISADGQH